MASGSAKIKEAMTEAVVKGSKEITTTMTEALKNAQGGPEVALRAAAEKHKTGSIIINKKGPRGTWAYFHRIDGQQLAEIDPNEFQLLCHDEGGGGSYQIKVKVGKELIPFGPYEVFGTPRAVPKSSVPEFGAVPPVGTPIPGGATKIRDSAADSALSNNMLETMKEYQDKLAKGASESGDRQMTMMQMFMMQQQQSSDALVRTITAAFAPRQSEPSASPEFQALREELKALKERERVMEQERRDRDRQSQIEKLNEQIQNMRLESLKPQDGGMSNLMGQIFTAQQNSTSQNTELLRELMRMNADKPTQSDQMAALVSTMIGAASTNIELVSKAVNSGLLGGSDSPIKEAVVRSLESIVEGLPDVIRGLAGAPQQFVDIQQEGEEMPAPQQMGALQPPVEPQQLPEASQVAAEPQASSEPQESPEPQQEAPQYTREQLEELRRRMLTDDEVALVQRDKALTTILAKIQNGVSVKEISLRVWAHKESRNRVADKWWNDPFVVTQHLIGTFGVGDEKRAELIHQDMASCRQYIESGGDPNDWSDTDYRPVKKPKEDPVEAAEEPPQEDPPDGLEEVPQEDLPEDKGEWAPEVVNEGVAVVEGVTHVKE
jgi:hypothetical protein